MLRVLLVDDEPQSLEALRHSLGVFSYVTVAGTAGSGSEAVAFLQRETVDLVFLDIEMGDVSGFDLARNIQTAYPNILIVFQTGHAGFALDGYEYKPLDFLVKPVNLLRLERILLNATEVIEKRKSPRQSSVRLGLPMDGRIEIIQVDDVLYIEKEGRRVFLVDRAGKELTTHLSLQKLQDMFEPFGFFRCYKSFLVQVAAIRSIYLDDSKHSYNIALNGTDRIIQLSRDKYGELRERLMRDGIMIC